MIRNNLAEYEQRIRERMVIDETSPSGVRWSQNAHLRVRGRPAGTLDSHGYWQFSVCVNGVGKILRAHRVIWLLAHGSWPKEDIDHINGDRADNRLVNLREASRSENNCNRAMRANNSSSVKGVCFHKGAGKWMAYIQSERNRIHLGLFANLADAECAVRVARERIHGKFANHGAQQEIA